MFCSVRNGAWPWEPPLLFLLLSFSYMARLEDPLLSVGGLFFYRRFIDDFFLSGMAVFLIFIPF